MKVLKFGAVWCPSCLIMRPRWEEIEKENNWLETCYYDYDVNKDQIEKWNVKETLPIFIFIDKEEKELARLTGEYSKEKLIELIKEYKDR